VQIPTKFVHGKQKMQLFHSWRFYPQLCYHHWILCIWRN